MARKATDPLRLSALSIDLLKQYLSKILEFHRSYNELQSKMEEIDIAYARYQTTEDKESGTVQAGINLHDIIVPVVISQVDSFVGHLADVYLTGYPIFPVVSTPNNVKQAEMLESIIDTHAVQSQYARHFLMAFRDGIKYNFMALEHAWEPIEAYQIVTDYLKPREAAKLEQSTPSFTRIARRDPYNVVWDMRYSPADVCYEGEFCGYIDLQARIPLKRFINRYSQSGNLYNISKISASTFNSNSMYYRDPPEVNEFISRGLKRNTGTKFNWSQWLEGASGLKGTQNKSLMAGLYERFVLYIRIIPSEFMITNVPKPNSPQIFKVIMINMEIIYVERIYTAYDMLPMLLGQPLEDGLGIQTKSIGESQVPMQEAASRLFDIRFNAARRAVSDRAIYDALLIDPEDVNAPYPAPKIPARIGGLSEKTIKDAYFPIPFDGRGTENVIRDAAMVLELSDKLFGQNKPSRGEFQKGNKSVVEWQQTMEGSEEVRRLPALTTEYQVMMPIKESIKQNIFQKGVDGNFQNQKTGDIYKVTAEDIAKLRETVLSFRVADGFTPKSKLASSDAILQLVQSITQNQVLAQSFGVMLPKMIAHLAQLMGIRGLDQYLPAQQPGQQNAAGSGQPPAAT